MLTAHHRPHSRRIDPLGIRIWFGSAIITSIAGTDVLVIGAGPAGAMAAWRAAELGVRTLVLERKPTVGVPVRCGECLSEVAIARLGLPLPQCARSTRVRGIQIVFPGGEEHLLAEPGVVLNKDRFEQWLVEQSIAAGAKVKLQSSVGSLQRTGNHWHVETKDGHAYRAAIVIDASGVSSVTSTQTGLNDRPATRIGLQYLLTEFPSSDVVRFYLWPHFCPNGYLWVIPKSGDRAYVGLVTSDNAIAKKCLDDFIAHNGWQENPRTGVSGGTVPAQGPIDRTFADGLLIVGDAAGFASPLFEGGTHLALVSGELAARTAAEAIRAGKWQAAQLAEYQTKWNRQFPNFESLIKGRHALNDLAASELDQLSAVLPLELSSVKGLRKTLVLLRLLGYTRLINRGAINILRAFELSRARRYGW